MRNKNARPSISESIQRELWARAAGRCEFRGCNKLLYKDELTQKSSNLAVISHIVAYSPDGPRGDPVRSKLLERDINNLMLTCRNHGKLIDDKALETEYPEDLLLEFKREHELRIRILTEAKEEAQTYVLLLQVPIDVRPVKIDQNAAFQAILPKYPAEETPIIIDLNGIMISSTSEGFFQVTAQSITEQTKALFRMHSTRRHIKNLSIFALAPVPLLIHFGRLLGDIDHVDLYQRHRDAQNWSWKEEEEGQDFYEVHYPADAEIDGKRKIALLLSISTLIRHDEVVAALREEPLVYKIQAKEPGYDFLRSRKRLEVFGYEVRKLLEDIYSKYDHNRTIHLFAAVPAPVAIEFGRSIKEYHPPFLAYEYQKNARIRIPVLQINNH